MADAKISALTELTAPDIVDEFVTVDKSDTSEAASGTDKRILAQTLDARFLGNNQGVPPTGVTYQNYSRYNANVIATGATLATGTLKMMGMALPAGFTVTNISLCSGTTALINSGSGPHGWAALFDSSRNLLRQSTDDVAIAWAANTLKTFTLSSTFVTTYTGLHYVGLMIACGSTGTMPTAMNAAATSNVLSSLAPVLTGNSSTGQTGTAPNPAGAITGVTNYLWCGVG